MTCLNCSSDLRGIGENFCTPCYEVLSDDTMQELRDEEYGSEPDYEYEET